MILLVNICKEKLHYSEFVKPICDILEKNEIKYFSKDYKKVGKEDLEKCSKIIICGTSLYDNDFAKNINFFKWILETDKPILGICGGMQIIGLLFNGKIRKGTEIGFYSEYFKKGFLGLKEKQEVYHLHNNYIDFTKLQIFEVFCGNEFSQAIKHKEKPIYGVLFHPEVRQKQLIENFCKIIFYESKK
ncbi:GMP synthase [glutamine-hydrolyzing] subunit A [uncultured archaeon]|nr:GMP synthase [glutamine-hydrolyzing] subunit A [uncultured archaeon]